MSDTCSDQDKNEQDDASSVGSSSSSDDSADKDNQDKGADVATFVYYPPGKSTWGHIEGCKRLNRAEHSQQLPLAQALEQGLKLCSKCPEPPPQPKVKSMTDKKAAKVKRTKQKRCAAEVPILMVYHHAGNHKGHLFGCKRLDTTDATLNKVPYAVAYATGMELCSKCPTPEAADANDASYPCSWCNAPPSEPMEPKPFIPSTRAPLVQLDEETGKLKYQPYTDRGDRVLDWSHCGYKHSEKPLPTVKVVETLTPPPSDGNIPKNMAYPKGTDSRKMIQQALDRVGAIKGGGAVLLQAGTWYVHGGLVVPTGVVLRGEGNNATKIIATPPSGKGGKNKDNDVIIWVNKGGGNIRHFDEQSRSDIVDDYVPSGSTTVTVADATKFSAGNYVCVLKSTNDKWIETIGCGERLRHIRGGKEGANKRPWNAGAYQFRHICQVVAVEGNVITLDCNLPQSIEAAHGGGRVYNVKVKNLGSECAVEGLEIVSNYDTSVTDQKKTADYHNFRSGIQVTSCRDAWVRDCTVRNVSYAAVAVGKNTLNVTVRDCKCLHPVGPKRGGEQYAFCINDGSHHLFYKCYSEDGRHDFVGGSRTVGPFAFVDCTAVRGEQSEPHHRWGCGYLYDHITTVDGNVAAINRGDSGSGHGWAAANTMIWNASAKSVVVFSPETTGENNFAIGFRGPTLPEHDPRAVEYANTRSGYWGTPLEGGYYGYALMGNGHVESPDKPVKPESLFVQQLIDRIGKAKADAVLK